MFHYGKDEDMFLNLISYIAGIQNIPQDNARTSQGDVRALNKFKLQITFK